MSEAAIATILAVVLGSTPALFYVFVRICVAGAERSDNKVRIHDPNLTRYLENLKRRASK